MGQDRPWLSVMPDSGEDEDENYKTSWEFTSKKFKKQLCTVKRALGGDDIGRFKLRENVDYNVQVGTKVFYSKVSSSMQRAADAEETFKLRLDFGWGRAEASKNHSYEEDGTMGLEQSMAGALFVSLMAMAAF